MENKPYYEKFVDKVVYYPHPTDNMWNKEVESILPYLQGDSVLDIGCGARGAVSNATRMDLYEEVYPDIVGDATILPLNDNSFDSAYSIHSIEHFQNTKSVLEEWLRVIKPNGYLCLVVPNAKYIPTIGSQNGDRTHVYDFTPEAFNRLLDLADFNVVSTGDACPNWSFHVVIQKRG